MFDCSAAKGWKLFCLGGLEDAPSGEERKPVGKANFSRAFAEDCLAPIRLGGFGL